MFGEMLEPDGLGVLDQQAENASALRQISDRAVLLLGDAVRHEVGQAAAPGVEHSQCAVPGLGNPAGRLHDPVQHGVQVQVGADGHDRLEQRPGVAGQAELEVGGLVAHGPEASDPATTGPSQHAAHRHHRRA
jgi:hypothetical protein